MLINLAASNTYSYASINGGGVRRLDRAGRTVPVTDDYLSNEKAITIHVHSLNGPFVYSQHDPALQGLLNAWREFYPYYGY